jgi:hypothetical protein
MSTTPRRGLVLVEILLLLAMAATLLGLALAAAQQVREAAALIQCGNNLRQLSIAAHNANDTYRFVPSNPDTVGEFSGTTQYLLLPFMECGSGFREGSRLFPQTLLGHRCPADPTSSGDAGYGPGNYVTNQLLFADRFRLSDSVPDGTSQTVLFAEKYGACSYWALTSGREVPWYTADPDSGFQVRPEACDPALPQSPHRRGIQVGMADGGARLVGRSVGRLTWYAANTPAGAEKLGSEPYADWAP